MATSHSFCKLLTFIKTFKSALIDLGAAAHADNTTPTKCHLIKLDKPVSKGVIIHTPSRHGETLAFISVQDSLL